MYVGKMLQPTKIYAGCIAEFENVWPDSKSLIAKINKETENVDENSPLYFANAITVGENVRSKRTNKNMALSLSAEQNEFFRELNNRFFFTVLDAVNWYKEKFEIVEEIQHSEGYVLLKYQTGQEYKAHYDGGSQMGRAVSPILYLNDNYTGGELEFVNFGIKIKPKAGTLYLFPSTYAYTHIAHPVKSGTKYAIVTWLHDIIV